MKHLYLFDISIECNKWFKMLIIINSRMLSSNLHTIEIIEHVFSHQEVQFVMLKIRIN